MVNFFDNLRFWHEKRIKLLDKIKIYSIINYIIYIVGIEYIIYQLPYLKGYCTYQALAFPALDLFLYHHLRTFQDIFHLGF